MNLLYVVNSIFGAHNNPGFRPYQVVRFTNYEPLVLARGASVNYKKLKFPLPGRSLLARGLNFIRIKYLPTLPARTLELKMFDFFSYMTCKWGGYQPDVVHMWDHLPRTIKYWTSKKVPVLLDLAMAHPSAYYRLYEKGLVPERYKEKKSDPILDECLEMADFLICPSTFVKESLPSKLHHKCKVVPFGADYPELSPEEKKIPNNKVQVLFAGNVNYRKGVEFLLDAWRLLQPTNAELILCGRVFKQVDLSSLPDNVTVKGFVPDIERQMQTADIFVLPSLLEGSAKAVYQAMSYGVPVIVTPHSGAVVENGKEGFVVGVANSKELSSALHKLIADKELRRVMGRQGRSTASKYTWEAYANRVADLYTTLKDSS